jgi:hypothetical protein
MACAQLLQGPQGLEVLLPNMHVPDFEAPVPKSFPEHLQLAHAHALDKRINPSESNNEHTSIEHLDGDVLAPLRKPGGVNTYPYIEAILGQLHALQTFSSPSSLRPWLQLSRARLWFRASFGVYSCCWRHRFSTQ